MYIVAPFRSILVLFFFFQAEDGIRDLTVTGVSDVCSSDLQLGIARHQLVLQMHRAAVEGQALDAAMRRLPDGAAGGFIDAARFHPDKAVLHEIEPADARSEERRVGKECRSRWAACRAK